MRRCRDRSPGLWGSGSVRDSVNASLGPRKIEGTSENRIFISVKKFRDSIPFGRRLDSPGFIVIQSVNLTRWVFDLIYD
jgi:hypothetical protein